MVSKHDPKRRHSRSSQDHSVSTRKALRKDTSRLGMKKPSQQHRDPPVYRLKKADGDLIPGTFYEAELQKVIKSSHHLFRIDKIRGRGVNKEVLVH